MKHSLKLPAILAAILIAALLQAGCKENRLIDSKILPPDSGLGIFDTTLSVVTHTYYDDTAITSLYFAGLPVYQGVGSVSDPFFGTMTGSTHFQIIPVNANIGVYLNMVIDSAVLVLPYSGFTYGDTADQTLTQSYQAFLLNEDIAANNIYYSYSSKQIDEANPLSDVVSVNLYHLKDSLQVNGVKYRPGLRMKLNKSVLLNKLMPALTLATNNETPYTAFQGILKGICVRSGNSNQSTTAYPFFRLDATGESNYASAGIIVYYHPDSVTADTLTQHYYFNPGNCGFFNKVSKTYSHFPVNELLTSIRPADSVIAIANQPGASLDIVIPGLKSLPSGVINRAELQLTVLSSHKDSRFLPIARLFPILVSNGNYPIGSVNGSTRGVLDAYPISSLKAIMDGTLHSVSKNGNTYETYVIGMPREVMASRTAGNDTLHLRINGTQDYTGVYRAILGGGNHPDSILRAKFFVVYSKLNN